ncbi:MAG TPA: amidohydrolase family protein [Pirellulales bacterium]|nr:amidohydrolase family protein [Pirellulales bacterium]
MPSPFITRRRFVRSLAAAAGAAPALNLVSRCQAAERKHKFIDIHTHLGTFYWGRELSADGLVRLMDKHDIERAVVLPLVSPESAPYPQTTEAALAAQRAHPDRLIAFCAVDPRVTTGNPNRYGHVEGLRGIKEIIERYKDLGARGFGEHKVGLPFDHPLMMMVYESCSDLDLPILFHLDDIRSFDGPGLPRLENVLKAFPKLPLIGHAAGFWASISGDATNADFGRYPRIPTPVAAGGALDRLMEKYSNLYGDLSEPGGYSAIARDRDFGRAFVIRRADQLLFGTDFLMPDQEIPHFALYESLDLPEDVQQKVYRGNALRLLKIKA